MYRIINSLATAEFNKCLSAVEVKFKGYGEYELYHDTMDIAMNIAFVYGANRWFFIKDSFEDIDENKFLYFVRKWSKKTCELFVDNPENQICKVALLTSPESKGFLLENNPWLASAKRKFFNLNFKIFTDKEEATEFLTGRPNKMVQV